jgi:hypothetical protein
MNRDQGDILVTWFVIDRNDKPPRLVSRMDVQAALIIEPNALSIETYRKMHQHQFLCRWYPQLLPTLGHSASLEP